MLPDLEQLIALQALESSAIGARAKVDEIPARLEALDTRLQASSEGVSRESQKLEEHKAARQVLDKELATIQTRLSRFKGQLMEVKTNKEYQAMQHEIAGAEAEVGRLEDQILERMLEADELASDVQRVEREHKDELSAVTAERSALESQRTELEKQLAQLDSERTDRASELSSRVLSLFETLARQRNGVAVVRAHDGRCSSCQVRLRPQLFNNVRLNETLIQCESCQRILYHETGPSVPDAGAPG